MSFRRTFTWFMLLVVLPSAGLSGFGILAIVNERAAVEKRVQSSWEGELLVAAQSLFDGLRQTKVVMRDGRLRGVLPDGDLISGRPFTLRDNEIHTEDPALAAALRPLVPELAGLTRPPAFFSVASARGSLLIMALRDGDELRGAVLDPEALQPLLSRFRGPGAATDPPNHFVLSPVQPDPGVGLIGKLASEVAQVRQAALASPFAQLPLPPPLQDFRLVAASPSEEVVEDRSTRNRAFYGVLLGLFYLTLAFGVVLTARSIYRQVRLDRLKTDFVSLVSHELRTPLTSIRMFIETLAQGRVKDAGQTQEILLLLAKESERLSEMIERVLDWARIESGRKQYQRTRTPVTDLVQSTVDAFRAQRLGAEFALEIDVPPGLPDVAVDRQALTDALLNLLQNAWKYSGENKRIIFRARAEGGGTVAVEVQDFGPGIPLLERKKIFDRFYRVDSLLTRKTEGSGLGLSIAKRIVEAHGGRVTLKSEVGRGSTFTVHLPRAASVLAEQEAKA